MRPFPLLALALSALSLCGQEGSPRTFRQWLGGQEVGGSTLERRQEGGALEIRSHEWMVIARLGQEIRQEVHQTARRTPEGTLAFTWRLHLSSEPIEGRAEWSPKEPGVVSLHPAHGTSAKKDIPPGALLWPEDLESRLREAARTNLPIRAITFSFPFQQWSTLELEPQGPAPLPGFPDAVRFKGREYQGPVSAAVRVTASVEVWISPAAGKLRHRLEMGSLEVLTQRTELPAPTPGKGRPEGFFERTLQKLPPHPLQPWIPELTLRTEGPLPDLPETPEQTRLPNGRWRLRRAAPPTPAEAEQPAMSGTAAPGEAPFLAPSSLVPFQDPAFEGLIRRMALPPGLSRWELAQRVNTFVFEWIADKDFSVGFASAAEICRLPRGDCTEHGVLAVALLRRLGVPSRGVTGWVGLGDRIGLHFWIEVRLKDRWMPLDPTLDQAPASALRIKLGDTDLSDLGSVGWEGAAQAFSSVRWIPERAGDLPWDSSLSLRGDLVTMSGMPQLRLPGGTWNLRRGVLQLRRTPGTKPWRVQAVTRPGEAQIQGARRLAGAKSQRQGWWVPSLRQLWMDLGARRWILLEGIEEADGYFLLDQLTGPAGPP